MKRSGKGIVFGMMLLCSQWVFAEDEGTLDCSTDTPSVIKHLNDYKIVATNMGVLQTSGAFHGKHLVFSVSAKPNKKDNELAINPRTGELVISAGSVDKFEVVVNVVNSCGKTHSNFHVTITPDEIPPDEEE
jgi:hypothetical protein